MGRRLKILSLCTRYLPMRAGADNMMHQVHQTLIEMGHDVVVVAVNNEDGSWPESEVIDGVLIERSQPDYGYEMTADAVERHKPDVLFGQFALLPYAIERAVELDLPIVVFCHTHHGYVAPMQAALVEMVDLFVFNSTYLYEEAGTNVRHVIVNPPLERQRVIAAERSPEYVTLINLCEHKGTDIFYHLARKFPEQKFLGVEGGYEDQIKEDLPNVEFCPHDPDIASIYAKTRVLLMPSKVESFGMAAVEAQANGIPVIASDVSSLHDALGDGALYVNRKNKKGWATALQTLLVQKDYYERIAARGRSNIARHDFRRDMRLFEIVLQDVVRKHGKRARPSVHRLLDEYAAAKEQVLEQYRKRLKREPSEAEIAKVVEGLYRPDKFMEVLGDIADMSQAAVS